MSQNPKSRRPVGKQAVTPPRLGKAAAAPIRHKGLPPSPGPPPEPLVEGAAAGDPGVDRQMIAHRSLVRATDAG